MSSKEQILQQIKDAKAEIARQKAELQKVIQANFHSLFQELFSKYPEMETITWNQYTPYFQDGDECIFSANVSDALVNGKDRYDVRGDAKAMARLQDVTNFLALFDDEDYKGMFDDHVEITVTREKILVEEYDHG